MKVHFLFLVLSFRAVFSNDDNKYCSIATCTERQFHTMCRYEIDWPNPHTNCGRIYHFGLTIDERKAILDLHNYFKSIVYQGLETRGSTGPQPRATNFRLYSWDKELADIAKRWAFQCKPYTDWCRDVERFRVGQTVGYTEYNIHSSPLEQIQAFQRIVTSWYNEVERYNSSSVQNFEEYMAFLSTTHRYTQLIWVDSFRLGCGYMSYKKDDEDSSPTLYLVCNYGPYGNVNNSHVYDTQGDEIEY